MDSPRLNDAVAARVVAWHNRHPLARRIGAAQVHSVGYVVLPFVLPSPAPPAAGGDHGPERLVEGRGAGSLRERALARARQGAELPLPVAAAPAPSAAASAANAMPP
ncbi:MAG TPA: hypothetical protein VK570_19610, partial [Rubrivivax sp.]|nr:hypothetical protein [Rubrivivax sp.]